MTKGQKEAPSFLGAAQDIPESKQTGTLSTDARVAADKFFAHKHEHPDPVPADEMTSLQRRMQSGGARPIPAAVVPSSNIPAEFADETMCSN